MKNDEFDENKLLKSCKMFGLEIHFDEENKSKIMKKVLRNFI